MAVYEDVLDWSQGKQKFVQDALRRIIKSSKLTQNDINELVQLVKKECGDSSITINAIPFSKYHIPITNAINRDYTRLISISKPINICALYEEGNLQFSNKSLTVIYGSNGSGKSSYSRILKKLCWSRNPSVTLSKNVFNRSASTQQVDFEIERNNVKNTFTWTEKDPNNPILKSIFVFDNDCSSIYINSENPTEYKPVGIDLLEKLISTFTKINQEFDLLIASYNTQKPPLPTHFHQTSFYQWYGTIEKLDRTDIESNIQFTQLDIERKQELTALTSTQNPLQNISNLTNQITRINSYKQQISKIESYFSPQNTNTLIENRKTFENISQAYQVAAADLQSFNTLEGFGSNPWRTLWEAAKNYANSSNLSDGENFPSLLSLQKCVLCQQDLDELAQKRLITFNQFVLNDVSTQLKSINATIQQKISSYKTLTIPPLENFSELDQLIPDFSYSYNEFCESITTFKDSVISFLNDGGELNINLQTLIPSIEAILPYIDSEIDKNKQLLRDRTALNNELNELSAKEFLFLSQHEILQYFDESKFKSWIRYCQSHLTTTGISRKIGEIITTQAVNLQHQEFISHLSFFNRDLASKVLISKTRTSQGNTYQKCSLNGINQPINSIMSDGEQKIIALSNFLAECTIDNRLNTIVFDDPVTSLDLDYRCSIASKIVQLAQNRQVIIFTHDLSFLRLLIDTHKSDTATDCRLIGIDKNNGISGIVTDEIPYLFKNVQERVDSIKKILSQHDALDMTNAHEREVKLDSVRKRFRMLLERSVEEILSNKTIERFSKNIHLKKGNLSSYIITEQTDVDFLLSLFSKYSVTEHDGGISTIPQLPTKIEIEEDIRNYAEWKDTFKQRLKSFQSEYNY